MLRLNRTYLDFTHGATAYFENGRLPLSCGFDNPAKGHLDTGTPLYAYQFPAVSGESHLLRLKPMNRLSISHCSNGLFSRPRRLHLSFSGIAVHYFLL